MMATYDFPNLCCVGAATGSITIYLLLTSSEFYLRASVQGFLWQVEAPMKRHTLQDKIPYAAPRLDRMMLAIL